MKINEITSIPLAVSAKKAMDIKTQANQQTKIKTQTGTQGTQGTVGPGQSQNNNKMDFARGQEIAVPNADNPNKPETYKVSAVQGDEVELKPKQNKPGLPNSIKFKKTDLAQKA